jgi:kynurenine formamidase
LENIPKNAGRFIDVSHPVEDGMRTYPGLPGPSISEYLSREKSRRNYAPGTEFHIGKIEMVANTGTYLDAPFHRYAGGADIAEISLSRLADLPGVVVRAFGRAERAIGLETFDGVDLAGRAVLIHTGWSRHWNTNAYFEGHPYLTEAAAARLADGDAALVGIDSLNVDAIDGGTRPAHSLLLARGIPIVEHLTGLEALPAAGFRFFAVPPKMRGIGSFPVRAFALL